ncbi:MAG: glycosyl hydrolase [Gemmatimonadaceae bacterium]|nr:glycosyl hydrolase [Gemmatimonadaceae bacterium]
MMLSEFAWRPIGPAVTSGRVVDLAVAEGPESSVGDRLGRLMYAAAASGGVWKSINAGTTWEPVFDRQSTSSIGDIALAPTNPEIVWVGTGESNNQRSSSWGDGVYKSENGGRTWQNMGLRTSQHIGRIIVHPSNANVVFVAAVGPLWTSGGERGLFKTTDGGKTWRNVLRINEHTGVTDVIMDPTEPNTIYAASFQRQRKAYSFVGGGPGSAIHKSIDGGESWTKLTEGLPTGDIGRIGLDVSRSQPRTVYATMETKQADIYRSDDYGASWRKTGTGSSFPWYMGQIRVDPRNADRIYFLGVPLQASDDGGKTMKNIMTSTHVDHHALWIDPTDPNHFVLGNDGGVYITHDRGETADFVSNLPIAQYYAIGLDMRTPFYYVYGGLQDNNSLAGPSQTRNRQGITNHDWYFTVGGDGFYSAVDPTDPNVVYSEYQNGGIVRYDVKTGEQKSIKPQPKFGQQDLRWNWSAPLLISPHDHKTLYFGANYLFRSPSRGDSWETLGPDLTRQVDRDKLPLMGKLWTKDAVARHQGVADYGNISTIDESPIRKGLLYVGTDDGLVQVSRDGGATWTRIQKFPGVPDQTYVSRVVASAHSEGTVYVTLDGHRSNDFKAYAFRSTDYGKTWASIAGNLPPNSSLQVIREHTRAAGLLFVGNEIGAYYSSNAGRTWSRLQYNLPTVPVHDIQIHPRDNDLVIGTHGRGIYIIDDITPLERLAEAERSAMVHLFPVKSTTLFNYNGSIPGGARGATSWGERSFSAPNPPFGSTITYYVKDSLPKGRTLSLAVFDSTGKRVRELTVNSKQGLHRSTWDLRMAAPYSLPRAPADKQPNGAFVLPGRYTARLSVSAPAGGSATSMETALVVNPDPLIPLSPAEYRELHLTRIRVGEQQGRVQAAVRSAEALKEQTTEVKTALRTGSGSDSLTKQTDSLEKEVDDLLLNIRGRQGPAANDVDDKKFDPSIQQRVNQVAGEIGDVTSPATQIQRETLDLAMQDLGKELARLNALLATRVPALNRALDAAGVPWTTGRAIR